MRELNYVWILYIISVLIGLHLYYTGFMSLKEEITEKSQLSNFNYSNFQGVIDLQKLENYSLWNQPQSQKVIFILLDGVRYDLVDDSTNNKANLQFNLKMNVFQDFLKKNSSNAMLFNSYADAPTATMQRVKALMIGDLPQFIEISNNFNTEQVINTLKNYINENFF